jgi:hypothetical protein
VPGPPGPEGPRGAAGAGPIVSSDLTYEGEDVVVPAFTWGTVHAICPEGSFNLSGSCDYDGGDQIGVSFRRNRPTGQGWQCDAFNNSGAPLTIHAHAYCYVTPE